MALGAAGCGGDNTSSSSSGANGAYSPQPPSTQQKSTPTATTPAGGRSPISISGTEYKLTPANVSVKSGKVTFRLRNDGAAPHALEIEGNGVEKKSQVVNAGQTTAITVTLKPGKYDMYCPVDGHRQMGMKGQVTVS
jgi:uncharacterized cupredoxin-like copper-binding protein